MFDERILDSRSFGELSQGLDLVLERIKKIEDGLSDDDEEDPRLAMLYGVANKILMRMDSIMREYGRSHPETLATWEKAMEGYEERFTKYTDFFLEEGTLLDL